MTNAAVKQLAAQAGPGTTTALLHLLDGLLAAMWRTDAVLPAWHALLAADLASAAQLLDRLLSSASQWDEEFQPGSSAAATWIPPKLADAMGAALLDVPGADASLLAACSPSGMVACLLARLQLARGDAARAWELLSPCLQPACSADPETVQRVVTGLYEERRFEQASLGETVVWSMFDCMHG